MVDAAADWGRGGRKGRVSQEEARARRRAKGVSAVKVPVGLLNGLVAFEWAARDMGIEAQLNLRTMRPRWRAAAGSNAAAWGLPGEWVAFGNKVGDLVRAQLKLETATRYVANASVSDDEPVYKPLIPTNQDIDDVVQAMASRDRVDPLLEWTSTLTWDGTRRLDGLLHAAFACADGPLERWCSRALPMGAMQLALDPGSKLDESPALLGPWGLGKTTFIEYMLPPHLRSDGFGRLVLDRFNARKTPESLEGRILMEFAELRGSRGLNVTDLTRFLSENDDGSMRMSWAKSRESAPRMVAIGFTSPFSNAVPQDGSGIERRLVPVWLPGRANADGLSESLVGAFGAWHDGHRDQLWAEAQARVEAGESARRPRKHAKLALDASAAHGERDEVFGALVQSRLADVLEPMPVQSLAYLCRLGVKVDNDGAERVEWPWTTSEAERRRFADALRHAGWEQSQKPVRTRALPDGKKVRVLVWSPPPSNFDVDDDE